MAVSTFPSLLAFYHYEVNVIRIYRPIRLHQYLYSKTNQAVYGLPDSDSKTLRNAVLTQPVRYLNSPGTSWQPQHPHQSFRHRYHVLVALAPYHPPVHPQPEQQQSTRPRQLHPLQQDPKNDVSICVPGGHYLDRDLLCQHRQHERQRPLENYHLADRQT